MRKIFLILAALLILISSVAYGDDGMGINDEQQDKVNGLYNYINNMDKSNEILRNISPKEFVDQYMKNGKEGMDSKTLFKNSLGYIFREVVASFEIVGQIMVIAIVCALLNNLQSAFGNEKLSNVAYFACLSVMIILIAKGFYIGVALAQDVIKDITNFMMALMPVLIMLLASIGNASQALVMDPLIMGLLAVGSNLYSAIIIPIICMSFALDFVNSVSSQFKVGNLTKLLKQTALWVQGAFLTIFVGVITIKGITSNSLDVVATKTAKFAVDKLVPVVGKTLSDAFSTVASYTMLLKSSVGLLGVVILIGIVLVPIIKLFVMAFMYKMAAALLEPVSDAKVTKVIDSAGGSMVLLGVCVLCVSIMFFIMISIIAATGKGFIYM